MLLTLVSLLMTALTFGTVGWIAASQPTTRSGARTYGALALAGTVGFLGGGSIILFGVDQFKMLLSWAALSACLVAALRLALTNRQLKQLARAGAGHSPR